MKTHVTIAIYLCILCTKPLKLLRVFPRKAHSSGSINRAKPFQFWQNTFLECQPHKGASSRSSASLECHSRLVASTPISASTTNGPIAFTTEQITSDSLGKIIRFTMKTIKWEIYIQLISFSSQHNLYYLFCISNRSWCMLN